MKLLIIDNYDSFTYNLVQYIGIINPNMKVVRNDKITIDEIKILKENETIFIPQGSKHRLANKAATKLIIIEFWYGDILDENDIERFEDIYERI